VTPKTYGSEPLPVQARRRVYFSPEYVNKQLPRCMRSTGISSRYSVKCIVSDVMQSQTSPSNVLSRGYSCHGLKLTTRLNLVSTFRMSETVPTCLHLWTGTTWSYPYGTVKCSAPIRRSCSTEQAISFIPHGDVRHILVK